LLLSSAAAEAQVLLVIDDSNPADVTITATGNNASTDVIDNFLNGEVDLTGFFTGNLNASFGLPALSTNLASGGSAEAYGLAANAYGPYAIILGSSYNTLSLYDSGAGGLNLQQLTVFSSDSPAFSGSASFDFSDPMFASLLPSPGTVGTVGVVASEALIDTSIGQWEVISTPEPRSWILALAVAIALAGLRYQRRPN